MAATLDATPPPPDPPELPEGLERRPPWPPWFAAVGFLVAMSGTFVLIAIALAITGVDPQKDSPALVIVGTVVQGVVFAATAIFFASRVAPPKAWHFGLRRAPFWPTVGWAAAGMGAFYLFATVYAAIVQPSADQGITEKLGADDGTLGLVAAGVVVIVVAPAVEEFFFRGFFYRALRSRYGIIAAATIDGVVFGLIHYPGEGLDGLLILPPLAALGFIFCLVYERTGSLFPTIAMHAFNNTVAYAVQADEGWRVSLVVGPLMFAACALVPRAFPRAPRLASA